MPYNLIRSNRCLKSKIEFKHIVQLICLFVIISCIFLKFSKIFDSKFYIIERIPYIRDHYLINTEGCKIPLLDPFDNKILKFLKRNNSINCRNNPSHKEPLTYFDNNNLLRLNKSALIIYNSTLEYCEYQEILRPNISNDDAFKYTKTTQLLFNQESNLDTDYDFNNDPISDKDLSKVEFLRIACYSKDGNLIYTNFHAHIVQKLKTYLQINKPYNFLILGVDSVSRVNSLRYLKSTRSLLQHKLKAIEFNGFNKVADNTFVNLVPMFLGKFVEEIVKEKAIKNEDKEDKIHTKETHNIERKKNDYFTPLTSEISFDLDGPFDELDFIWKKFKNLGFKTLFAEDAPKISIFNYNKKGFYMKPTDHYMRPFSLALEDHGSMWSPDRDCVGTRLETEVVLDYVTQFLQVYKSEPHFAFAFLTRLTHEVLGKAEVADQAYFQFFENLLNKNLLKNTIVLFYSDHGMRFGDMRQTFHGKLEERLPFLFIALPALFLKEYPQLVDRMNSNVNSLVTPFDVHQTLIDLFKIVSTNSLNFDSRSDDLTLYKSNADQNIYDQEKLIEEEKNLHNKNMISIRGISLFNIIPASRTCNAASIATHWCVCQMTLSLNVKDRAILSATDRVIDYINELVQKQAGIDKCAFLRRSSIINAWHIQEDNEIYYDGIKQVVKGIYMNYFKFQIMFSTVPGNGVFEVTIKGFNLSSNANDFHSLDIDSNDLGAEFERSYDRPRIEANDNIYNALIRNIDIKDRDFFDGLNNIASINPKNEFKDASNYLVDEEVKMIWKVLEISRISAYGDESACVEAANIKKYCYC